MSSIVGCNAWAKRGEQAWLVACVDAYANLSATGVVYRASPQQRLIDYDYHV